MTALDRHGYSTAPWTPENIEKHPLWELEVELERGMHRAGADSVRDAAATARERGQLTRLKPLQHLMSDWVPFIAKGLTDWVGTMRRTRGPKPIALPHLEACDHKVAALVGLRAVLDGMTNKRTSFMRLAVEIGTFLEHETQVRLWEDKEPKLYHAQRIELDRAWVTDTHRTKVNIHRFNTLMQEGIFGDQWVAWTQDEKFRVGATILQTIVRTTNWFEYAEDLEDTPSGKKSPKLVLSTKPGLLQWLEEQLDHAELRSAQYQPTVVPPRRWDGCRKGGYWTPYVKATRLVRFHASQEEQREKAADDYDALDMPDVYEAIHFLQEVPWRVNLRTYLVAQQIVSKEMGIAGIPLFREVELPRKPWEGLSRPEAKNWIAEHPEEHKAWKREAAPIYRKNAFAFVRQALPKRTLRVALQYLDHTFYFPHMMDFRGRMYPIPVGLQPQGDDLARGLLRLAEGKPLGERGAEWLAIHLASCWGNDKVAFADRIQWVRGREQDWRHIDRDPLGYSNLWAVCDKPFQALAAVFEWVSYLDEGPSFVSHLPIAVDGTCNGIQHLSAMMRDEVAGKYVNLLPSDHPEDIYKFVADKLHDRVKRIHTDSVGIPKQQAGYWLDVLGADWSRKLTKRPVMVLPYGGTRDSYFEYTRKYVMEVLGEERCVSRKRGKKPIPKWTTSSREVSLDDLTERNGLMTFLVQQMWDTVNESIAGAKTVMEWLQKCAKAASGGNQPIFWKVPTGFVVRHFYGRVREKDVTLMLDGHRTALKMHVLTDQLDVKSQLQGIAPNFVHSQDAAALTMCINAVRKDGITAFTAVHDAFGTHACDMDKLALRLRESFVELHSQDALASFRAACQAVVTDSIVTEEGIDPLEASEIADDKLPSLPPKGNLRLEDVLKSDYFFA